MFEEYIRLFDQKVVAINLDNIRAIEPDKKGSNVIVHYMQSSGVKQETFDVPYCEMLKTLNDYKAVCRGFKEDKTKTT